MIRTIRHAGPAQLVRGQVSEVEIEVLDDEGQAVDLYAWSVELSRAGTVLASAEGDGAPAWTRETSATATLAEDYLLTWRLTEAEGDPVRVYRQPAVVCVAGLWPMVEVGDLVSRHPRLGSTAEPMLAGDQEGQVRAAIAAAWGDILDSLQAEGRRPWLILDARALRPLHIARSLELIFRGAASALGGGEYLAMAQDHAAEAERIRRTIRLDYAPQDDAEDRRRTTIRGPLMAGGSWR